MDTSDPTSSLTETSSSQSIDALFETMPHKSPWAPPRPPQVLGELLDSRYMLPFTLPSDPRLLGALPRKYSVTRDEKRVSTEVNGHIHKESGKGLENRGFLAWRSHDRKLRELSVTSLQFVDGIRSAARWTRTVQANDEDGEERENLCSDDSRSCQSGDPQFDNSDSHITPLTRKPSAHGKGRHSHGDEMTTCSP
jgi:hypothetical protein